MATHPTPALTATGPHIDGAVETSFQELLRMYQKTLWAQEAYNKFVGAAAGSTPMYDEFRVDIQKATMGMSIILEGEGIRTLPEAEIALGPRTNYLNNRTDFRVKGLLTGIDMENLGEPFSLNALKNGFFDSEEKEASDDILYNTGVTTTKQSDTKLGYSFSAETKQGLTTHTKMIESPAQFFGDTAILQYLANKAFFLSRLPSATPATTATPPAVTGNPYKDLALLLATDTKSMIDAQAAVAADLRLATPSAGALVNVELFSSAEGAWNFASRKMDKIIEVLDAIGPSTSPKLPLQDYSAEARDIAATINPVTGVGGRNYSPSNPGYIEDGESQILYANTIDNPTAAVVRNHMGNLNAESYHNLFLQIIQLQKLTPTALDRQTGITVQVNDILAFFGCQAPRDPLPDEPELASVSEAARDKEAGKALQEALFGARRNLTPFDMQCYLMENIEEIVAKRKELGVDYKHVKILGSGGDPATVTNTLQHGGPGSEKSKRIEQILNLCPEVYASLVPYIKIYRVDYEKDGSVSIDPETKKAVEKELVIPNFVDPADIANIMSSNRGRIPGAGIKSFSWSLLGVQPEEVDNNITAKLVIYFQSINDFFRGASQAGKTEPNFLDLLINSPAAQKRVQEGTSTNDEETTLCGALRANKHRRYEGQNYRIKVVAGWSAPTNLLDLMPKKDPEDITRLKEALEGTKVSLFLQQVRHSLDFQDDGAMEMSIDYQASIAGLLTSPRSDIFAEDPTPILDEIKEIDEDLEFFETRGNQITEYEKKKKKELLEKKKALATRGKMHKYKKLLEGLFNPKGSKIHAIEISGAELLMTPYRDLSPEERAARAKRRLNPATGTLDFSKTGIVYTDLLNSVAKAADDTSGETNAAEDYSENAGRRYENLRKNGDIKTLPFFFLGDLIDNIIEQMKKNNNGQAMSFDTFLSDVDMINPLMAFQVEELDEVVNCGNLADADLLLNLIASDPKTFSSNKNKIVNLMNIGDIPISTEAFQLFFKNRVVKKNRETYHFLYFIKELCAELITKALNKTCFGQDVSFRQRFDVRPHTYIQEEDNSLVGYMHIRHLAKQSDILPSTPIGDIRQALIVLPSDSKPRDLKGSYADDTNKGIFHQYIGASCGLLKTLKFNREDQAYLREGKIQREGALGAEQLRELYSSTLELVGNNLYKNGMYIYINPTLLDASKDELDYLGLHGYYLVTSVQSTVTPEGFTTSLTALHEGIEFNAPILEASFYEGLEAEAPPPDILVVTPGLVTESEGIVDDITRLIADPKKQIAAAAATTVEVMFPITGVDFDEVHNLEFVGNALGNLWKDATAPFRNDDE